MAESGRGRSSRSDLTPNPGPGPIPNTRELNSLDRCNRAVKALFGSPRSRFARFSQDNVARHLSCEALAEVIRWYWYNEMEDKRTKASDIKREMAKVVTHLASLKSAMAVVQPETRHVLNRLLKPPTIAQPERQDIFGEAERLNNLILELCRPIVAQKFTKESSTSAANACDRLAKIWENITQQPFDRNTKATKTDDAGKVVTDSFEFEYEGMQFVHILLQAIDPAVTYSKVRSGMRRRAASTRSKR